MFEKKIIFDNKNFFITIVKHNRYYPDDCLVKHEWMNTLNHGKEKATRLVTPAHREDIHHRYHKSVKNCDEKDFDKAIKQLFIK